MCELGRAMRLVGTAVEVTHGTEERMGRDKGG